MGLCPTVTWVVLISLLLDSFVVVVVVDSSQQNLQHQKQQQKAVEGSSETFGGAPAMADYCNFETFNASCPEGSVILMMRALYGRMRMGRCLKSGISLGCYSDVLRELDARCSGQPSCTIGIPDASLHQNLKCGTDMMAYLEAGYKCLQVAQTDSYVDCDVNTPARIMAQSSGFSYLSSYWMRSQGWTNCPLSISVPQGQKIELYVFDFSPLPRYQTEIDRGGDHSSEHIDLEDRTRRGYHDDGSKVLDYCQVYASVTELRTTKDLTVCRGSVRESHVYSSLSSSIVLQLSEQVVGDTSANFLVKYGVSGCPDLAPPKNAWITRDKSRAVVTCNFTGLTWYLVCKGTNWIGKEAANDCEEKSSQEEGLLQGPSFPTYGLLTAVITGVFIGAVCGFSLLGAVLWCKRRSSRPRNHKECSLQMIQESMRISGPPTETTEYDGSTTYDPHYHHHHLHHHHQGLYVGQSRFAQQTPDHFHSGGSFQPPCKVHHRLENGEYGYTHVWEIAGNEGESKHPNLPIMGGEESSPDGMALSFSAYSPSSYNGTRLINASPMAQTQNNLMTKPSVSSFKPQRQDVREVCSYQSCSKQLPPNYTFVKLSEGSQGTEDTGLSQQQKPILDHPSLLQDHIQKMNSVTDRCGTQPSAKEPSEMEWCPGNSKDFCGSSECCSSEQSKPAANLKKLENHYT